ncbi:hypothetical protein Ancab_040341 [Ancistrocladus abbreviatus]
MILMSSVMLQFSIVYVFLLIWMCSMQMLSIAAVQHPVARNESNNGTIRCIEKERQALLQFKQGLVDDYGILTSWGSLHERDDQGDCCQWTGVKCSKVTGHVISLDLRAIQCAASVNCRGLQGNISSSLLMLEQLNYLDLSGNDFGDHRIPGFIGSLGKLAYLNLSNYRVRGEIPPQFVNLTSLESLDLSSNSNLFAENFAWASALSLLKTLNLGNVQLTEVTDWFHVVNSLPSLTYLNLGYCFLPDPFPLSHVNSSKSLGYIYLGSNRLLAASMYPWLLNISNNLVEVDLSFNYIKGPIPKDFGNMNSLTYLDLSSNELKGFIPEIFGRMSSLLHLDLSGNKLKGPIPETFGNLSSLSYLDLSQNNLQGSILSSLSNMSSLSYLDFCSNQLEDSIPDIFGKMSSLSHLGLCMNKLQGRIPEEFGSITSLSYVDLSKNQLQGPIPETLGNLTSLSYLRISSNQLHGPIPKAFGRMTSLSYLDLSESHLEGTIPVGIGSMRSLQYLYLSINQLEGRLPNSFRHLCSLQELYLYGNNLTGDLLIPLSRCIKKSLVSLYLEDNSLSGPLPDFTTFLSLTEVSLSHNQLNGSFPFLANKYSSLESLDLQNNQITGSLPQDIGKLSNLLNLDMSSNLLDGIISKVHLSNLTSLESLDLSFNKLAFNISPNWTPPFKLTLMKLDSCRLGPQFPKWLQRQNYLDTLSMSNAGIADTLPRWFWRNFALVASVNLSQNGIHGVLPDSMFQKGLTAVDLSFNSLQGPVPSFLTQVTYLDLSNNKLSGLILSWCPATNAALQYLDLSNNFLSGELPDCWAYMNQARVLNFGNNSFTGTIPSSFGKLNLLEVLSLSDNKLSGKVPSTMKNCTSLRILDISENFFSGPIPSWIGNALSGLNVLILRHNQFSGSLPLEICHLPYIQILDLSINMISRTIPTCFYNITELSKGEDTATIIHALNTSQWTNVDVSYHLNGSSGRFAIQKVNIYAYLVWKGLIRKYVQNLALVRSIDLSSNKLTGKIPVEIS